MSKLKIIKVQMLFLDKFQHQMSYKKTRRLMTGWTTLPFYLFPLFILFFRTYIHVLIILYLLPFPQFLHKTKSYYKYSNFFKISKFPNFPPLRHAFAFSNGLPIISSEATKCSEDKLDGLLC